MVQLFGPGSMERAWAWHWHVMAFVSPCVRMLDLMRVYDIHSVLRFRVACLWIGSTVDKPLRLGVGKFKHYLLKSIAHALVRK